MSSNTSKLTANSLLAEGNNAIIENNDIAKALTCFEKALLLEPENLVALHNCGDLYNSSNRYEEAHALFSKLCRIDKNNGINWYNLAISLIGLDKLIEANKCIEVAYKLNPELMQLSCGKNMTKKIDPSKKYKIS